MSLLEVKGRKVGVVTKRKEEYLPIGMLAVLE